MPPSPSRRGLPADALLFTNWLPAFGGREVFGETPHTARGTRALPGPIAWYRIRQPDHVAWKNEKLAARSQTTYP